MTSIVYISTKNWMKKNSKISSKIDLKSIITKKYGNGNGLFDYQIKFFFITNSTGLNGTKLIVKCSVLNTLSNEFNIYSIIKLKYVI